MKVFQFLTVFFLAGLMLFSSSTFALNLHFCGDELAGITLKDFNMVCGMKSQHSPENDDCTVHKKDCCHTQQVVKHSNENRQDSIKNLNPQQQVFATAFFISYSTLFSEEPQKNLLFKRYVPPLLVKDINVYHEIFLI